MFSHIQKTSYSSTLVSDHLSQVSTNSSHFGWSLGGGWTIYEMLILKIWAQTAKKLVFFSKSVKNSVRSCVQSYSREARDPDLLFDCSHVLEYAKIRTVLQSKVGYKYAYLFLKKPLLDNIPFDSPTLVETRNEYKLYFDVKSQVKCEILKVWPELILIQFKTQRRV